MRILGLFLLQGETGGGRACAGQLRCGGVWVRLQASQVGEWAAQLPAPCRTLTHRLTSPFTRPPAPPAYLCAQGCVLALQPHHHRGVLILQLLDGGLVASQQA